MELNQLRWRCRRGMRELDLILTRFLDQEFVALSGEERHRFAAFLDSADPDLYAWLLGRELPPPPFAQWIERLQAYRAP